jgi:hypothetical protein
MLTNVAGKVVFKKYVYTLYSVHNCFLLGIKSHCWNALLTLLKLKISIFSNTFQKLL